MLEKLREKFTYTQTIVLSFVLIILIGSLLLSLPIATANGQPTPILNAMFTATSATCVTGLVIYDTFTHWSTFGHIVILCLIQIGGLGFMSLVTMISVFRGKRIGIYERRLLMQSEGNLRLSGVVKLLKRIIIGTFSFELIGAVLLSFRFCQEFGFSRGIFFSVFHSISAFCNAGFDLMGVESPFSSLTNFHNDPLVCITLMFLIVIGGLGFLVWNDILNFKFDFKKYSLHSKIVFATTFIISVASILLFLIFEDKNLLNGLSIDEKLLKAAFLSISPRTAGFNTLDLTQLSSGSEILTIILMFIGGSPGSTAGGIKITTVAVLFIFTLATARHNTHPEIFKRSIPIDTLKQASSIFFLYISAVIVSTALIATFENSDISNILFEAVSAIGTVGLSKGLTPTLSGISKLVLMMLMFGGRVGGLSLFLSLAEKKVNAPVDRPKENVIVG
ncbi:MAG: Trk family potassium uptake protein [Clostridia bacterium]|nr:Trk family potassium uptake protein [Clostridia bacterium]